METYQENDIRIRTIQALSTVVSVNQAVGQQSNIMPEPENDLKRSAKETIVVANNKIQELIKDL